MAGPRSCFAAARCGAAPAPAGGRRLTGITLPPRPAPRRPRATRSPRARRAAWACWVEDLPSASPLHLWRRRAAAAAWRAGGRGGPEGGVGGGGCRVERAPPARRRAPPRRRSTRVGDATLLPLCIFVFVCVLLRVGGNGCARPSRVRWAGGAAARARARARAAQPPAARVAPRRALTAPAVRACVDPARARETPKCHRTVCLPAAVAALRRAAPSASRRARGACRIRVLCPRAGCLLRLLPSPAASPPLSHASADDTPWADRRLLRYCGTSRISPLPSWCAGPEDPHLRCRREEDARRRPARSSCTCSDSTSGSPRGARGGACGRNTPKTMGKATSTSASASTLHVLRINKMLSCAAMGCRRVCATLGRRTARARQSTLASRSCPCVAGQEQGQRDRGAAPRSTSSRP